MSAYHRLFQGRIRPFAWVLNLFIIALLSVQPAYSDLDSPPDSAPALNHYIKLGVDGEALDPDSQQWACVADQVTGLMWEKRDPSSALHGLDTFTWYQPEQLKQGFQRAHPDSALADTTCYGFHPNDPASFCNTHAYADRVNQSNYCGYSDWRLPTAEELLSLINPTRKQQNIKPLLDTHFFPFHDPFLYWTNTVNDVGVVMTIFADDRVMENSERSDNISVRLVRGTMH